MNEEFNDYLKSQFKDELIPGLSEFIKIPNVSRNFNSNWKKDGLQLKAATFLKEWFDKQNIPQAKIQILQDEDPEKTPCLLATVAPEKAEKTVLIYGHIDK